MKTIGNTILPLFLVVVLLSACSTLPPPSTTHPTKTLGTPQISQISPTPTFDSQLLTPIPPIPTTFDPNNITINTIVTPNPNEQVYTDPDGWYSVIIPADMESRDKPNVFVGSGITFETGYLPEMGYVSRAIIVCAWLANIELTPKDSRILVGNTQPARCSVSSDVSGLTVNYSIYENPGADPEHRFVYIKISHYWNISTSGKPDYYFSWLKPISKKRPETGLLPLSPEDASFWQSAAPMPAEVSVTEGIFLPIDQSDIPSPTPQKTTIEQLGYQEKYIKVPMEGCAACPIGQLYRDGRILFDYVTGISDVHTFSTDSGSINAFVVAANGAHFLIQNDVILPWDRDYDTNSAAFGFPKPILYKGELLWKIITSDDYAHLKIRKSNREIVFTLANFDVYSFECQLPRPANQFIGWKGHWILTAGNLLVEDGEIINKKLGFQEIMYWTLINDKPVYIFHKGARYGVSYNGQILPLQYEDIKTRGCPSANDGYSVFVPEIHNHYLRFSGKRDGVWYDVVVEFK